MAADEREKKRETPCPPTSHWPLMTGLRSPRRSLWLQPAVPRAPAISVSVYLSVACLFQRPAHAVASSHWPFENALHVKLCGFLAQLKIDTALRRIGCKLHLAFWLFASSQVN